MTHGDEHQPPKDPRLEIPEVLRTPVKKPELPKTKIGTGGMALGEVGTALAIGIDFLSTFVAGAALGWLIDRWLGSAPAGLLIGLGAGFVGGTVRLLRRLNKEDRRGTNADGKGEGKGKGKGAGEARTNKP